MPRIAALEARRRRAIRVLTQECLEPGSVPAEQIEATAAWLEKAAAGGEHRHFDLRIELAKRGKTQTQFAKDLGLGSRIVAYWISGGRHASVEMAQRVAAVLGLAPSKVVASLCADTGIRRHYTGRPTKGTFWLRGKPLVGANLAAARRSLKLRQCDVAAAVGCHQQSMTELEHSSTPRDRNLLKKVQHEIQRRLDERDARRNWPRKRG